MLYNTMCMSQEDPIQLRDMNAQDLPRERLVRLGRSALTDEELIAIFLRTGLRGCNVLELAALLKRRAGSLAALGKLEAAEIMQYCKGIGPAKAATLAAVFELGQRAVQENLVEADMRDPAKVYEYLAGDLCLEGEEHLVVLLLNTKHKLLRRCDIGKGTLSNVLAHPRNVFRPAIVHNAAAIILAHNHPSGDPRPSRQDIEMTNVMVRAGEMLHIPVVDHVILGHKSTERNCPYYSFRAYNQLR